SFWVLVAVLLGQNLFGVFGMILFIPLTSVIYTILKNDTNRKLSQQKETEELSDTLQEKDT
ncbi:MAG: AI-2E family transporter, partial [Oscillospiraceae bacterium]|nr:AI-2E family transporter [Oscillospiraceae bacterium]